MSNHWYHTTSTDREAYVLRTRAGRRTASPAQRCKPSWEPQDGNCSNHHSTSPTMEWSSGRAPTSLARSRACHLGPPGPTAKGPRCCRLQAREVLVQSRAWSEPPRLRFASVRHCRWDQCVGTVAAAPLVWSRQIGSSDPSGSCGQKQAYGPMMQTCKGAANLPRILSRSVFSPFF